MIDYKLWANSVLDQVEASNEGLDLVLERLERAVLRQALIEGDDNRVVVAKVLGLKRTTLIERLRKYNLCQNIPPREFRSEDYKKRMEKISWRELVQEEQDKKV